VSYGLTVRLLDEVLPFDRPIGAERVRRHLFRVAEAHEAELISAPTSITLDERTGPNNALPDGPLFVGMDGGYVRGREQAWFEAIAGKSLISFHRDGRDPDPAGRCFAFVQTEDDKPRGSSTHFANKGCSRNSRSFSCPTAPTLFAACSRTSPRRPSTCWTVGVDGPTASSVKVGLSETNTGAVDVPD
jgi:hypothetical protein